MGRRVGIGRSREEGNKGQKLKGTPIFLYIYLSACISIYLSIYLYICLSIFLIIYISFYISLSIYLLIYLGCVLLGDLGQLPAWKGQVHPWKCGSWLMHAPHIQVEYRGINEKGSVDVESAICYTIYTLSIYPSAHKQLRRHLPNRLPCIIIILLRRNWQNSLNLKLWFGDFIWWINFLV